MIGVGIGPGLAARGFPLPPPGWAYVIEDGKFVVENGAYVIEEI